MNGRIDPLRLRLGAIETATSLAVVVVSLLLGLLLVTVAGYSPGDTIKAFWNGAFVGSLSLDTMLETAVPLLLAALAWIVAFRAGRINVGIEGQILAGGATATVVGLYVHLPIGLHLPLTVLAAVCGGAVYAAVAAALWAWRGVNEIISTFMLNLIAGLFVTYLVTGPLQESTHQQPISPTIPGSARWPGFFGQLGLSWDLALAPVGVALVAWTIHRTTAGFRLRMTGENPEAARHVGVPVKAVGAVALIASGALGGLAASSLLLSSQGGALQQDFSSNFGFNGIAVALLARNSALGCVPAALLFAALREGGGLVETEVGVDTSLVDVTFGIVVILAAASLYLARRQWRIPERLRVGLVRPRAEAELTEG